MKIKKNELNPFILAIILFIIASLSGFLLSYIYSTTKPIIKKNEKIKEQNNLKILMPDIKNFEKINNYFKVYGNNNKVIGYVFKTSAKGYSSEVVCNVGINSEGKVTGVIIISEAETPGLGSKIEEVREGEKEPYYLAQYKGKNENEINFENIQAISGATISSRAVLNSVKKAFKIYDSITKKDTEK